MVEYFSGMISTDDPKHARLRRIVSNAFNPRNIRAVEDSIERKADEIIERARLSGTGDFITDIAAPFPLEIICDMMGVPSSEYATVLHHSNIILSNGDPDFIPKARIPYWQYSNQAPRSLRSWKNWGSTESTIHR